MPAVWAAATAVFFVWSPVASGDTGEVDIVFDKLGRPQAAVPREKTPVQMKAEHAFHGAIPAIGDCQTLGQTLRIAEAVIR